MDLRLLLKNLVKGEGRRKKGRQIGEGGRQRARNSLFELHGANEAGYVILEDKGIREHCVEVGRSPSDQEMKGTLI